MSLFLYNDVTRLLTHPESVIFLHHDVTRFLTRPRLTCVVCTSTSATSRAMEWLMPGIFNSKSG